MSEAVDNEWSAMNSYEKSAWLYTNILGRTLKYENGVYFYNGKKIRKLSLDFMHTCESKLSSKQFRNYSKFCTTQVSTKIYSKVKAEDMYTTKTTEKFYKSILTMSAKDKAYYMYYSFRYE